MYHVYSTRCYYQFYFLSWLLSMTDFIPIEVMGLVIIVTLEAVEDPGLTTTTGVPELVGNPEGLGRILLPLDPGKLWVIIFMPVK